MVPWYTLIIVGVVAFGCGYGFRGWVKRKLGWIEQRVESLNPFNK